LIATGEFEAAQRALAPLLTRHPDDLELHLLQADVLAGMEAWKALLPYLDHLPAPARSRAVFWHLRGLALVNLGDAFHSRLDLERAAHMEPTTVRFVLDAGHGCAELGEWERSEAHWRQALRLEPTLEEALVQLAEARRVLHDLPGARQLLRECLTHHPASEDAQVRLAELEAN
jgi:Flp pilus assembly protein TadD